MVVCNARATSFTKANVTNMCDNWIGKGGSMSVSHNNFFYAHPTPCLPASPLQISAVCNARATPTSVPKVCQTHAKYIANIHIFDGRPLWT